MPLGWELVASYAKEGPSLTLGGVGVIPSTTPKIGMCWKQRGLARQMFSSQQTWRTSFKMTVKLSWRAAPTGYDSSVRYELFVDMGEDEGGDGARSVKRTLVGDAFPAVGAKMRLLFDYGDEWEFLVELIDRKPKEAKVKLPRLLASVGIAPEQYPDPEED